VDLLPAVDLLPGLGRPQHELPGREAIEGRSEPMVEDVEHDRNADPIGEWQDLFERSSLVVLENQS
jgi:hypothetical protein